ncbi:glycosyl transferase, partial [Jaminaea rosea]
GVSSTSAPSFIPPKPNAALLILCRNEDLGELLPTLSNLESTFNSHPLTSYPYVLLNDQEFTPYFKAKLTAYLASARQRFGGPHASDPDIRFGQVPPEHWRAPDWIDWEKAKRRWEIIAKSKVPYAMSESYRHMCRFQSGFFYRHPLVKDLDFYWRVEPQTRYTCNLTDGTGDFFDPFRWMKKHNKKYGWVLSLKEYQATIKTLWPKARMWLMKNPQYHSPNLDILPFISKEDKIGYNLCHFWNNFEIANLDFFRSEAYQAFFDHLEELGIFYYDRTGDAPVHTIAVSWFLSKEEVHQFTNIGYYHTPFHYCPQ